MWNSNRNNILMGNASMVSRNVIMIEYCSKLMRL
jgi:hypothetical protein